MSTEGGGMGTDFAAQSQRMLAGLGNLLARAVQSSRLYPPGSPLRQKQLDEAYDSLSAVLATIAPVIQIYIRPGVLLVQNQEIYSDRDLKNGVSYVLSAASVLSLSFYRGTAASSFQTLIQTIASFDTTMGSALRSQLQEISINSITIEYSHSSARDGRSRTLPLSTRSNEPLDPLFHSLATDPDTGLDVVALIDGEHQSEESRQKAIDFDQFRLKQAREKNRSRLGAATYALMEAELRKVEQEAWIRQRALHKLSQAQQALPPAREIFSALEQQIVGQQAQKEAAQLRTAPAPATKKPTTNSLPVFDLSQQPVPKSSSSAPILEEEAPPILPMDALKPISGE